MALGEEMEVAKELEGELSTCTKEMSDLQDFAEEKTSEKLPEEETEELFDNSTMRAQVEELCSLKSGRALDVKEQYAEMAEPDPTSEVPAVGDPPADDREPTPTADPVIEDIAQADSGTVSSAANLEKAATRWNRKNGPADEGGLPASEKAGTGMGPGGPLAATRSRWDNPT